MSDISSPSQTFFRRLTQNGYAQNLPQSTWLENYDIGVSMTMYENMSNSRSRVMKSYQAHNIQTILKAVEDERIPEKVFAGFRDSSDAGFNVSLATRYFKKHYGLDLLTNEEIKKSIREDLISAKERQGDLSRRAGTGGRVMGVMGSMVPYLIDPVIIPTYFIGYGEAAAGIKFLTGFGKFVAANTVAESAAEVFRYGWKNEVSEASIKDSIKTVAYAVGAVGGLGIAAHVLGKGISKFLRKGGFTTEELETLGKTWAEHKVAQMAKEMEAAPIIPRLTRARLEGEVDAVFDGFKKLGRPSTAAEAAQVFEAAGPGPVEAILKEAEKRDIQLLRKIHLAGVDDPTKEFISAAAVKTKDGEIYSGRTHYEAWKDLPTSTKLADDDGFITSKGRYLTREEARKFVGNHPDEIDSAELIKRYGKEHQASKRVKVESGKFPRVMLTDNSVHKIDFERLSTSPWKFKKAVPLSNGQEADIAVIRKIMDANGQTVWERPPTRHLTAVEHARALQAELEHQNSVHLNKPVRNVTQEPDITKGSGAREIPESLKPKKEGEVASEVETGSQKMEPADALDMATDQILKENPGIEIPERVELIGGAEEVVTRKASDVFKKLDKNAELANKFKECLIG